MSPRTALPASAWAVAPVSVPLDTTRIAVVDAAAPATALRIVERGEHRAPRPDELALPAAAARYAQVKSVRRWSNQRLDPRLVAIDEAVAAHEAGLDALADPLGAYVPDVLELAHHVLDVPAPAAVTVAVAETVSAAAARTPLDHPFRGRLLAADERLNGAVGGPGAADLDAAVEALLAAAALSGAMAMSGDGGPPQRVDVRLLPARVLDWRLGQSFAELGLDVFASDGLTTVELPLAPEVDAADVEGIALRAVDAETGAVVAVAPTELIEDDGAGPRLTATVDTPDGDVHYDFFHRTVSTASRFGEQRDGLLLLDGGAVGVWSLVRAAAAQFALDGAPGSRLAAEADRQAGELVWEAEGIYDPPAELVRRLPAVRALQESLPTVTGAAPLVQRPLLSELWSLYTA